MRTIFATVMLMATAFAASAEDAATFQWQGEIQPEQTLEIRNINGSIRAEPASGPQAEILVHINGSYPSPSSIRIDVVEHEGGILACTIYDGLSHPDHCTVSESPSVSLFNSDIRVQYIVRVPAGVKLVAKTVNGRITADLPDSPIEAYTVNGRVVLATGRPASAHVVNGSIVASLGKVEWSGEREFKTVNGTIDIDLPEFADVTVEGANVFGMISTDFPLRVHRWIVGSSIKGDINRGGPRLVLKTVIGGIHLRKAKVD